VTAPAWVIFQTLSVSVTTRNWPVKASPRGLRKPLPGPTNGVTTPVAMSTWTISPSVATASPVFWIET
jgi:hypothetical protein